MITGDTESKDIMGITIKKMLNGTKTYEPKLLIDRPAWNDKWLLLAHTQGGGGQESEDAEAKHGIQLIELVGIKTGIGYVASQGEARF